MWLQFLEFNEMQQHIGFIKKWTKTAIDYLNILGTQQVCSL